MTTSLFCRSYSKDAQWLRYCLRSLDKFATGFHQKVVVCPVSSHDAIQPIAEEFGWEYDVCEELAADDYVGQQATKMLADQWCSGDVICFIDSDVIFERLFTPASLVDAEGKILLMKTAYNTIECPWQPITEYVVGFPVEFEMMRRMPLAYPRELLKLSREHIEQTHGVSFETFIRGIKGRHLSEFNAIGAIAERFMPDRFHWIDTNSGEEFPPLLCTQHWSWGGITPEIAAETERILA